MRMISTFCTTLPDHTSPIVTILPGHYVTVGSRADWKRSVHREKCQLNAQSSALRVSSITIAVLVCFEHSYQGCYTRVVTAIIVRGTYRSYSQSCHADSHAQGFFQASFEVPCSPHALNTIPIHNNLHSKAKSP